MSKKNPFENLMSDPAPAVPAVEKATPAKAGPVAAKRKGPGRPPKDAKEVVQTTTIRLDPDDHLAVRQLALRDRQTMNELIFVALKQYCDNRGVRLTGK
jgi:predicted HicB family RNase H-like nuclease